MHHPVEQRAEDAGPCELELALFAAIMSSRYSRENARIGGGIGVDQRLEQLGGDGLGRALRAGYRQKGIRTT
jgi:hypothetical protein